MPTPERLAFRRPDLAKLVGATELWTTVPMIERALVIAAIAAASIWLAPGAIGAPGARASGEPDAAAGTLAISIGSGKRHSCALTDTGDVECWGANGTGQLGNGTVVDSSAPVQVNGLDGTVTAVAVGGDHTCALTKTGKVECWGWNRFGQLGDRTHVERHEPTGVRGLESGAAAISAGGAHACALLSGGGVECWGANRYGQLGDGTDMHRSTPVRVRGLSGEVVAVSAGGRHTCALTAAGTVECWGANYWGQLGDGTVERRLKAVVVEGLADAAVAISAGRFFTCAVLRSGRVACWGANFLAQLGDDPLPYSPVPLEVDGLDHPAVAVSAGARHACALTTEALVECWGANGYGQRGDPAFGSSSAPFTVGNLGPSTLAVSAGSYHTCALDADGSIACWGSNFYGQLGNGSLFHSPAPVPTTGLSGRAALVTSGEGHTCALTETSLVECWGWNRFGQLGDGLLVDQPRAGAVSGLQAAGTAAAGGRHTCALLRSQSDTASVVCWGANHRGQLGGGTAARSSIPKLVKDLAASAVAVSAGARHTCAVIITGVAECWGANEHGQLGNGLTGDRSGVSTVPGLVGVVAVDAGALHSCALSDTSEVACWGSNADGQLGDGTGRDRPDPVAVAGLPENVTAVAAGGRHSCALTTTGKVLCWGANNWGQLGNGRLSDSRKPVPAEGLSDVAAIDAGSRHTCAIMGNGDLMCWGANDWGQLGDGTNITRPVPTRVTNLSGHARSVSAGDDHTCAALGSGDVECWGFNYFGQLGDGRAPLSGSPTPSAVVGFGTRNARSGLATSWST